MRTPVWLSMLLVAMVALGGLGAYPQTPAMAQSFPSSRDPIKWPFPANSIWNMPIHNSAEYVYAGINQYPLRGMTIDEEILILEPNAPLKPVRENNASWDPAKTRCGSLTSNFLWGGQQVPVPDSFRTDPGYDGVTPNASAAILMPDGVTIKETQPLHVCSDGTVTSQYTWPDKNIKTSPGIEGSHGGTGMTAFGGDLRVGELLPGSVIRHALKMNFFGRKYFAYNNDGTRGYRWPAPRADAYAGDCVNYPQNCYNGQVPAFEVGALLALKPDFNISGLRTEPARILAQAMQNYGLYAVDDTFWDVPAMLIEWGPDGRVKDEFQQTWGWSIATDTLPTCTNTSSNDCRWAKDMWDIVSSLHVVNNNGPSTIGGGPNSDTTNRRAPQAPPFIGEGGPTATPSGNTVRIMPIGDSLTEGDYPNGHQSWRGYLRSRLIQNGYSIDFVGDRSRQAHGDASPADLEHAGHGGYTIGPDTQTFCGTCETTGIYEHVDDWVSQAGGVDVFMVLIGINDMFNAANHPANYAATADDRLGDLVAKLQQLRPNAKILLSSLLKVRWTSGWAEYNDLNAKAAALGNASATDNVYFVDLNSVNLVYGDFFDDVHLNQTGAQKVADGWYTALTPLLGGGGGGAPTATPTRTNTPAPVAGAISRVRYYPRSSFSGRMVGGRIQGSNTSSTSGFVDLATISTAPTEGQWSEISFSNGTVYRYVRYLSPNNGYGNVAELEFYAGATRLSGSGFGGTGAWNNGTTTFDKALDGNTSTFFDAAGPDGNYAGIDTGGGGGGGAPTATPVQPTATAGSGSSANYEAEAGTLAGGAQIQSAGNASGGQVIGNLNNTGASVQFNNVSGNGGPASLVVRFSNGFGSARTLSLYVNGTKVQQISFAATGGWNSFANTAAINITLNAGSANTIRIQRDGSDSPAADIDRITVSLSGGAAPTSTPVGPSPTRTSTPVGPSPTRTSTPVGPSPTRTSTPTSGGGYSENFDDGQAQNWTLTSAAVSGNQLVLENWGGSAQGIYTAQSFSGNYTYRSNAYSWASGYNDNIFYFNYVDANNFYAVRLRDNNAARLVKRVGGTETTIATGPTYNLYNTLVTVEIVYQSGGSITVRATKSGTTTTLFNQVSDTAFSSGRIGVGIDNNHLEIDNVVVTVP